MKETIPAMNAVNRETDSFMAVYWSSTGGGRRRDFARRVALLSALTLGMLTSGPAQTAIDPSLTEALRAFETAVGQKDIEGALSAFAFARPEDTDGPPRFSET
jgi:hypothetical protein